MEKLVEIFVLIIKTIMACVILGCTIAGYEFTQTAAGAIEGMLIGAAICGLWFYFFIEKPSRK